MKLRRSTILGCHGLLVASLLVACGGDEDDGANAAPGSGGSSSGSGGTSAIPPGSDPVDPLPAASCEEDGGSSEVSEPELVATLFDRWHEAWLGSPLARMEAAIAFGTLLERFPTLRLAVDEVSYHPNFSIRGLAALPVASQ